LHLDATGAATNAPEPVAVIPSNPSQDGATAAWNGAGYFVAWRDQRAGVSHPSLRGARVSASGSLVDGPSLALAADVKVVDAQIASNGGGNELLVYTVDLAQNNEVRLQLVDGAGAPSGSPSTIAAA